MTVIGIIGAGEVGGQIARAAIAHGYEIVIANSRGPQTLAGLVAELGPAARAATAAGAAAAGDLAVVAVPLKLVDDMPIAEHISRLRASPPRGDRPAPPAGWRCRCRATSPKPWSS